jgi:hypothetical protein
MILYFEEGFKKRFSEAAKTFMLKYTNKKQFKTLFKKPKRSAYRIKI